MQLFIDTTGVEFQVARPFEPRLDDQGNPRKDKQRGSGLPLNACQLVAWTEDGTETILVTVATDNPPKLTQKQVVAVDRLLAIPWVAKTGQVKVAYRADSVNPIAGGGAKAAATSAKSES